jgi:hypothetical protein
MNHAAHDLDKFIRATLRDAQNPRSVSNRRRPAVVDSDWVRHGFDYSLATKTAEAGICFRDAPLPQARSDGRR